MITSKNEAQTCSICGEPHKFTECSLVHIIHHVPDNILPTKAKLTLPTTLQLEKMSDESLSIKCARSFERGTQFGPFQAKQVFTLNPEIVFPLKIFSPNEYFSEYYLDTNNEDDCNWMMFVKPAANAEEQNLISFQEGDKIYFASTRDISAGEFLKVWYAPFYAKKMNANTLASQLPCKENHPIDLNSLLKKQQKLTERDTWTCKFCSFQEKSVIKFAQHIMDHYAMQIRKVCSVCKSTFATHKGLKKHMHIVHNEVNIKKIAVVKEHIGNKGKKEKNVTKDSGKKEKNVTKDSLLGGPLLNDVLTDSLDNTNLFLPQTEFDISNIENQNILLENENLNLNIENLLNENDSFNFDINDEEQYVCDICLKQFSKLKFLVQHLRKHTGKFTCSECLKIFCRNENLKAHKCNFKKPQYKCDLCLKSFSQKKCVVRHMQSVHEKKYQCLKCKKSYYCDREFRKHNCACIPDSDKEKHPCSECGKIFYYKSNLRRHMNLHMSRPVKKNNQSVICEICAKTFHSLRNLIQHKKTHLPNSHNCKMCNKSFARADILSIHIESCHSSETFPCKICDRKCKSRRYLKIHMKTHSEVKRFKCSECDQQFLLKANMMKHYNKKHKKTCDICKEDQCVHVYKFSDVDSYYECGLCKKVVKLRSSMTRHIKKVHPNSAIDFTKISKSGNEKVRTTQKDEVTKNITEFINNDEGKYHQSTERKNSDVQIESYLFLKDKNDNASEALDNLADGFENIVNSIHFGQSSTVFNKDVRNVPVSFGEKNGTLLDFNSLDLDLDSVPNMQQELQISNQEVCLSMPDLNDVEQDITLGENAFILDNGTIVEPLEQGNVVVYILDKKFVNETESR